MCEETPILAESSSKQLLIGGEWSCGAAALSCIHPRQRIGQTLPPGMRLGPRLALGRVLALRFLVLFIGSTDFPVAADVAMFGQNLAGLRKVGP